MANFGLARNPPTMDTLGNLYKTVAVAGAIDGIKRKRLKDEQYALLQDITKKAADGDGVALGLLVQHSPEDARRIQTFNKENQEQERQQRVSGLTTNALNAETPDQQKAILEALAPLVSPKEIEQYRSLMQYPTEQRKKLIQEGAQKIYNHFAAFNTMPRDQRSAYWPAARLELTKQGIDPEKIPENYSDNYFEKLKAEAYGGKAQMHDAARAQGGVGLWGQSSRPESENKIYSWPSTPSLPPEKPKDSSIPTSPLVSEGLPSEQIQGRYSASDVSGAIVGLAKKFPHLSREKIITELAKELGMTPEEIEGLANRP